jgi:hypothetical protein
VRNGGCCLFDRPKTGIRAIECPCLARPSRGLSRTSDLEQMRGRGVGGSAPRAKQQRPGVRSRGQLRYDPVDARRSLVGGVGYGLAFEGLIDQLVGVSVHLAGNPGKSPSLEAPTERSSAPRRSAPRPYPAGSPTTTSTDDTALSATGRPALGSPSSEQRLE